MQKDDKLEDILYYLIEKTNKVVRRYSQVMFVANGIDLTVDQWLVLKKINESSMVTQIELANALFKDRASITRILDLLLEKGFVSKQEGEDRRAYNVQLTAAGEKFLDQALAVVKNVRKKGIAGLSSNDLLHLQSSLQKIIKNLE